MHTINIITARPDLPVYYVSVDIGLCPVYFQVDADGSLVDLLVSQLRIEDFDQGRETNSRGEHAVRHSYISGEIACIIPQFDLKVTRETSSSAGYISYRFKGANTFKSAFAPPQRFGPIWEGDIKCYNEIDYNNLGHSCVSCYDAKTNKLYRRKYYDLIDLRVEDGKIYYYIQVKFEYSDWAKEKFNVDTHYGSYKFNGVYMEPHRLANPLPNGNIWDLNDYISRLHGKLFDLHRSMPIPNFECPTTLLTDLRNAMPYLDVNNIDNLWQLKAYKEMLPPIIKAIKSHNFKSCAELYLWWKYTYSTSMMDLGEMYKFFCNLAKHGNLQASGKASVVYRKSVDYKVCRLLETTRYHCKFQPYKVSLCEMLGLNLSLANAWDMVPWSFVVDWVLNIGDILARYDSIYYLSKLKYQHGTSSVKAEGFIELDSLPKLIVASLRYSYYERRIEVSMPIGHAGLQVENPLNHTLDGTALIVANRHH